MSADFGLDNDFDDSIDLTPLIDVVFMLLLFFILATTFMKPAIAVSLPKAATAQSQTRERQLVITIDSQGRVLHGDQVVEPTGYSALLDMEPGVPINFMVHRDAPFQSFMGVVDEARRKGRTNFIITTEPDHADRG
ncbi:biopolymer transport protein ExbD [Humidesulfovibrio mexicanus]|uniref:Biopolymer transport protein ExbD n=1 Tax=Humidesulfovibrio mexicanus TaxID=147047 RepID=A0A239BGW4_9BACT|nr:biopolymer transporter ExbD [Humidesulfovibrio mexicanus]SNS07397.1 biopolymer transport protein ExbD [Humidesulfovibrio mexicanus]